MSQLPPDDPPNIPSDVSVGKRLGPYLLCSRLASGGMAEVFLAKKLGEDGFSKWVAIKVILPHLARDERFVRMFQSEARLAARIDHPNVCSVFDFDQRNGTYFLGMEYLNGQPLTAVMRRCRSTRALPVRLAARIIADAARGLHAAHELRRDDGTLAEVVHRDVSPQNIFVLYSGTSKVVDFGIARSNEALAERTQTGVVKGKIAYMSPEQIRGIALDRRSDVFALGVVFWEALTGQRLFKRDNDMSSGFAVIDAPIAPPSSLRPGLPPAFDHIVLRALARERNQRYATALDLAREIDAALANLGIVAGVEDVAEFMNELFADEQSARQLLMQSLANAAPSAERASDGPAPEPSELSSALTVAPASAVGTSDLRPAPIVGPTPDERAPSRADQRERRRALWLLVLAPLFAVLATVAAVFLLVPYIRTVIERRVVEVHEVRVATSPETPPPARVQAPAPVRVARAVDAGAAAPEPRPRVTVMRPGFLTVLSSHPAEVFEGSRRIGRTPLTDVELRPGRHTLRFVPSGGLPPQTIDVELRPGGTTIRRVRWDVEE